jgi:tetratricopeptide (TPR) repeat protein
MAPVEHAVQPDAGSGKHAPPNEKSNGRKMRIRLNYGFTGITAIVVIVVALVYWPAIHANFVWDDWLDFHDRAWLRHGDEWKHFIFRGFNDWTIYFRPLGVALLTLQVRLFDGTPEPMHVVSLGMHLVNTFLVGLLSWRCSAAMSGELKRTYFLIASMLLYGLHPVLIEPVAWIDCQFDLVVTMLTLLGLLANTSIQGTPARATVVAILFFLAACAKESALSFPLLLVIFDWALLCSRQNDGARPVIRDLVGRNWLVCIAMLFTGVVYLAFRHWAIGEIINPFGGSSVSLFGRLQEVCFVYLHYWKTLVWPMSGMSPVHPVDLQQFNVVSMPSLLIDVSAISLAAAGFYLALRRASIAGCMIVAVTAALLPVLHIVPVDFDNSLYHERYAMNALAAICSLLPLLRLRMPITRNQRQLGSPLLAATILFWLAFAVINIRVTLPLWSNNVNLWQWALAENPDSVEAKDGLLSAYIDAKDYANAHKLITRLLADHVPCTNCMLNAAILAISENDPTHAAIALEKVKDSREFITDKQMFRSYLLTTGQMLGLQGHLNDSEQVLRAAMKVDPLDPQPQMSLAMTLALQGKKEEALKVGEAGIALLPPAERAAGHKMLDKAIASSTRSAQQADQAPAKL